MDEIEVHILESELLERSIESLEVLGVALFSVLNLGSHEEVFTRHRARTNSCAEAFVIPVGGGAVEVAILQLDAHLNLKAPSKKRIIVPQVGR